MVVKPYHGPVVLLASLCVLLALPTSHGMDFLKDLLACKQAGLPPHCNLPVPTTTVPAATPPQPIAPSPGLPPPPASPPGSGPSLPPNQGPGPAGPQPPSPAPPQPPIVSPPVPGPAPSTPPLQPPTFSPPVPGPAPSPVPEQAAPVPAPMPDTIAPAPAPAPMLLAPAPAPQNPPQSPVTLVISAGGLYGTKTSSKYTISTGIWSSGPSLSGDGRAYFPMIQLSSTEILAAGGDFAGNPTADIFSTVTQAWQATTPMRTWRAYNSMVLLPDGSAFTAGGINTDSAPLISTELYTQGAWADGPNMNTGRVRFTMLTYVVNSETRVLACGGQDSDNFAIASCEEWSPGTLPASGFGYLQSNLPEPVYDHRVVLFNGNPFITGGTTNGNYNTDIVQMLVNGAWTRPPRMQQGRAGHEMVVLQTGEALVCGGLYGQDALDSCEMFDGEKWSSTASLPAKQQLFRMLVLPNGDVLMYGSQVDGDVNSATWTPGAAAWVPIPSSANTVAGYAAGLAAV